MNDPTTIRRLYGRRQGHKLRAGQAALVEEWLPRLSVPEGGPLDARALFEVNLTRLAIRRGAWLRGYVYAFVEAFAPTLTRPVVEAAMRGEPVAD